MKWKFITLLSLFIGSSVLAQNEILNEYPERQSFYKGGETQFYKEAHEFLKKTDSKQCPKDEIYVLRILVTKDDKVKIVNDGDDVAIQKNKCAYDMALSLVKGLQNWTAPEAKGYKLAGLSEILVYPYDLTTNYQHNYHPYNYVTPPSFPEGKKKYDRYYNDTFKTIFEDLIVQGGFSLEYYVNEQGELVNPRTFPLVEDKNFNIQFLRVFTRLAKKKLYPALYNARIPIKYRISHSVDFRVNYYERD